jgi:4-amino-4-deoxy-L-arabinose transferase-like glycosyltransferase
MLAAFTRAFRQPSGFAVAALVISAWGAVVNFARLGLSPVAFDEPLYAEAGWRYVHGLAGSPPTTLTSNFDNFEHPPLAKYLFGLAQLAVGHPSVIADRALAASCALGTGLVLCTWLAQAADQWVGLAAGALVVLLPMTAPDEQYRFARYGYLDNVAELFAVAALAMAWVWFRRDRSVGWWWALATGTCVGLATSSKETAFLGVVMPVALGVVLTQRSQVLTRLLQSLVATATAILVFSASYVGLANPITSARYVIRFQTTHSRLGHPTQFAGHKSDHPPAWAFLWFAAHGLGLAVVVISVIAALAAVVLRHDRLVFWCLAALTGPVLFHMFIARVILGFYWIMWMPAYLALVAIGMAALASRVRATAALPRTTYPSVAAAMALALMLSAAHMTSTLVSAAALRSTSYAATVVALRPQIDLRLNDAVNAQARDSSGHGRPGLYVGRPAVQGVGLAPGLDGRSVRFNGFLQYVTLRGRPWMDANNYSAAVWFRSSTSGRYLLARDDFVSKVWNLQLGPFGHMRFMTYSAFGGRGQVVDSKDGYADGRTHFAVCVKRGRTMRLFVDGRLVGSAVFRSFAASTTAPLEIARRGNGSRYFAGSVADFAFFTTAVTSHDITALFQAGRSRADARQRPP